MSDATRPVRRFEVGDRVFGGVLGQPQRLCRVQEISRTGALRIQEVGGPRLPWWISPATAVEWAYAEALQDLNGGPA